MIFCVLWINSAQECWMTSNVTSHRPIRGQWRDSTGARRGPLQRERFRFIRRRQLSTSGARRSGTFTFYALHARRVNRVWKPLQIWKICALTISIILVFFPALCFLVKMYWANTTPPNSAHTVTLAIAPTLTTAFLSMSALRLKTNLVAQRLR